MADVVRRLTPGSPRFVACAPGLVNLMGGLADLAGGSVLYASLDNQVCVGAQRRDDGKFAITAIPSGTNGHSPLLLTRRELGNCQHRQFAADDSTADGNQPTSLAKAAVAALAELVAAGVLRDDSIGASLFIRVGADAPRSSDLAHGVAAATMVSASSAFGAPLDAAAARHLFSRSEDARRIPLPYCPTACLSSLHVEENSVLSTDAHSRQVEGRTRLPGGVAVLAIDTGSSTDGLEEKLTSVRAATYMGRVLIDRIMNHDAPRDRRWAGRLASVSAAEFVEQIRDRVPTKLKGAEFLRRFGEPQEAGVVVLPDVIYKVRSRTEHHIYEEVRTRQFLDSLAAAAKPQQLESWLVQAGEAMFASHWSYGQRCGLGSVPADLLVSLIREKKPAGGIYGAKMTGRGAGGFVAVLVRDGDASRQSIDAVLAEYERQTRLSPRVYRGSAPGALVRGARAL